MTRRYSWIFIQRLLQFPGNLQSHFNPKHTESIQTHQQSHLEDRLYSESHLPVGYIPHYKPSHLHSHDEAYINLPSIINNSITQLLVHEDDVLHRYLPYEHHSSLKFEPHRASYGNSPYWYPGRRTHDANHIS